MYGHSIWGSTFSFCINKLKSLQNKAVKIIRGVSSIDSLSNFLNKFSTLKLNYLFKMKVAKIVYASFTDNPP